MSMETLHDKYQRFLQSDRNRSALQALRQKSDYPDILAYTDPMDPNLSEEIGKATLRIIQLTVDNSEGITQEDGRRWAFLGEYALRLGTPQGAALLGLCYHFGLGVPQSFHQEFYFLRMSLLWADYRPDENGERNGYLGTVLSLLVTDSCAAQVQTRTSDALYGDLADIVTNGDLFKVPTEYIALYNEIRNSAPNESLENYLKAVRTPMTSPFVPDLLQQGHEALYSLAHTPNNRQKESHWGHAVAAYCYAAMLGSAEGACGTGWCCENAPVGDYSEAAFAWYKQAAKMGSAWAMFRVGQYYDSGLCNAARIPGAREMAQECFAAARTMGYQC